MRLFDTAKLLCLLLIGPFTDLILKVVWLSLYLGGLNVDIVSTNNRLFRLLKYSQKF